MFNTERVRHENEDRLTEKKPEKKPWWKKILGR